MSPPCHIPFEVRGPCACDHRGRMVRKNVVRQSNMDGSPLAWRSFRLRQEEILTRIKQNATSTKFLMFIMRKLLLLCILVVYGCRAKTFPGDSSLEAALKMDLAPASCRVKPFPGDSSMAEEDFWVYDPATCRKYYVFTSDTNEAARVDIVRSNIRRAMSIVNYSKEEARAAFFVRSSVDSDVGLCALFSIQELLDIARASETNARDMIANHHWHEEKTPDINEIWPQESE